MKQFTITEMGTGAKPLGESIPEDHSFFMLTCYDSGKHSHELEVGEMCYRRATTADGKHPNGNWILYQVFRLKDKEN